MHPFAAQSTTEVSEKFWGKRYICQISTAGKGPLSHWVSPGQGLDLSRYAWAGLSVSCNSIDWASVPRKGTNTFLCSLRAHNSSIFQFSTCLHFSRINLITQLRKCGFNYPSHWKGAFTLALKLQDVVPWNKAFKAHKISAKAPLLLWFRQFLGTEAPAMRCKTKCSLMPHSCSTRLRRRGIWIHVPLTPVHKLSYWLHLSVRMGLDHDSRCWTGRGWGWDTFCSASRLLGQRGVEAGVDESKSSYLNHWLYKWEHSACAPGAPSMNVQCPQPHPNFPVITY